LAAALVVFAGCVGEAGGSFDSKSPADTRFPSASEVGEIGALPAPSRISSAPQKDVESWDLVDSPDAPSANAPRTPATPWERLLADAAAKRQGLLWPSDAMHCLAKQAGQFVLAQGGIPNDDLTRFMAARCGVTEPEISLAHATGAFPGNASEDQFFASGHATAEQLIEKHLASGNLTAGIWAGRSKGKLVLMMPFAPRRARLDSVPKSAPPSGHVVIQGEVLVPAEHLAALANYGRFGFRRCVADSRVRLPRFSVDCETKPNDSAAMIEIAAFAPGRIMGPFVANLIVWPEGQVPTRYTRPDFGTLASVGTGKDFPANLVGLLNQVRKEAGLGAVTFNADESATAARVAPHYFASLTGAVSETIADRVVLGLRAGWQIPGLVSNGHFTSALTRNTSDATALLVSALNRPSGRETLLDPDVKVIAIGPALSHDEGVLGGVFTSYSLFEPAATQKEVPQVLAALNAKRKERGLGPAMLVESLEPAAAGTARSVESGERGPDSALHDLLERSTSTFGNVQGWFLAADKFERLPFPDQLLAPSVPHIAIGVAHFRPKGSPWGAYGVLVVAGSSNATYASTPANEPRLELASGP
jgi:hypothetical protein